LKRYRFKLHYRTISEIARRKESMAILSIELYLANKRGVAVERLAEALGLSVETVEQRMEAARLCVEYQINMLRSGY
jgi:hypothetical protein